jgi:hypothetical protein
MAQGTFLHTDIMIRRFFLLFCLLLLGQTYGKDHEEKGQDAEN